MKLKDLIKQATKAMNEHGNIEVCIPCEGYGYDEDVTDARNAIAMKLGDLKNRQAGEEEADTVVFIVV